MAHPVVHAEIRSQDPDATRRFFADLFGTVEKGDLPDAVWACAAASVATTISPWDLVRQPASVKRP